MAEYIEKKKALGIYVLKAFVVDDQGLEVAYTSLKPSKERRLRTSSSSSTQKILKKPIKICIFAKDHNKCLGVLIRDILYTANMVL